MKKILVTGAAGYLGCVLCEHLLDAGYHVTAVDNLMYKQEPFWHLCHHSQFEFLRGDVRDESLMKRLLAEVDAIVPLAAIVGAPACDRDPQLAEAVNLNAIRMLNKMRSPRQLVLMPVTNSGYGAKSGAVFCTEDTPLEPISHYGRTKVEAEAELLGSPNAISFRLATVFGVSARMRTDLLVNHFTLAAVSDGYLVIFEKDFKRNFIHIRDVADAFLHGLTNADKMSGKAYNCGLDTANISKAELALKIREQVPRFYVHFSEVGQDPDKRNYIVSNERLRQAGFEAKRSLEMGIRELVRGYRQIQPQRGNA